MDIKKMNGQHEALYAKTLTLGSIRISYEF